MPVYEYKCRYCSKRKDLWLDNPQDIMVGDVGCRSKVGSGISCVLERQWTAPGIGRMSGGASPSRGPK